MFELSNSILLSVALLQRIGIRNASNLLRVPFVVKQDEAANLVDVGLLGTIGVVFDPNRIAHLVKQLSGTRFHHEAVNTKYKIYLNNISILLGWLGQICGTLM